MATYPAANAQPVGGFIGKGPLISLRNVAIGGLVPAVSTDFNNSTPSLTEAYFGEITIPHPGFSTGVAVFNGSDVTGNITLALFDASGKIVAATAATAGSGTDAYQRVPWAYEFVSTPGTQTALTRRLELRPGTYYIGSLYSSTTARYNSAILGTFAAWKETVVNATCFATTTLTITPPATFTTNLCNIASLY